MAIPAVTVTRCYVNANSGLGVARLMFTDQGRQNGPIYPRAAVTIPIAALLGLRDTINALASGLAGAEPPSGAKN